MGGGGPSIPQRDFGSEWGGIKTGYKGQENQYLKFINKDPLLSAAYPFALQGLGQVPGLQQPLQDLLGALPGQFSQLAGGLRGIGSTLGSLYGGLGPQFAGYQNQLAGYQGQIPGLQNQLTGYQGQLGKIGGQLGGLANSIPGLQQQLGGFSNQLQPLIGSQQRTYQGLQPILQSQGALTSAQQRNVDQTTRAGFAARGNVMGNQALGNELLNRDEYRQQRFGNALNQSLGLSGSIGGLLGARAGITGQQAGLTGLRGNLLGQQAGIVGQQAGLTGQQGSLLGLGAGLTGQQAGLTGQLTGLQSGLLGQGAGILGQLGGLFGQQAGLTQGLTSGIQGVGSTALSNLLGTSNAGIGGFSKLTNPILSYLSDLNSSNQNAAAAQSIAGANKSSGAMSGGIGAIGSILGGVATAY